MFMYVEMRQLATLSKMRTGVIMEGRTQKTWEKEEEPKGLRILIQGVFVFMAFCLMLVIPGTSLAGVEEDIRVLREDMGHMKKDLADIKTMLQGAIKGRVPEKSTGTVSITGRPTLGEKDAPVTIVEFSDYQCPYCRRYSLRVFPALKRNYIDTGKVRYVFRDFPLKSIHRQAAKAHESAHCAGEHNKYWEMHHVLFQKQKDLNISSLIQYAGDLGIDPETFKNCLDSNKYAADVQKDVGAGAAAGVRGTPSFFIGKSKSGNSISGTIIRGAQPLSKFQQLIDKLL